MKELLKRLKEAEETANRADRAWEQDPENEELEKEFDRAYSEEHRAFNALAAGIVKMTSGKIDRITAETMLRKQRQQVERLIERLEG